MLNIKIASLVLLSFITTFGTAFPVWAQTASDFGGVGVFDTPTAQMKDDGVFTSVYSRQNVTDFYSLTYQALPWMEATFRYSIPDARRSLADSRDTLRDRSYDVKFQLLSQSKGYFDLSLGLRDFVGTGIYSSEYLVASRKNENFVFSLGMGWGRLASLDTFSNPLAKFSNEFDERQRIGGLDQTGEFRTSDWFSGTDVGLFGSVEYKLPEKNLNFQLEYNSDAYDRERSFGTLDLKSPLSFGLLWVAPGNIELGVSWQHGSQLSLKLASNLNSKKIKKKYYQTFPYQLYKQYPLENKKTVSTRLSAVKVFEQLEKNQQNGGYNIHSVAFTKDNKLVIGYENKSYQYHMDVVERISASLKSSYDLSNDVDEVVLVPNENDFYPVVLSYNPEKVKKREHSLNYRGEQIKEFVISPNDLSFQEDELLFSDVYTEEKALPSLRIGADLDGRLSFFDPVEPLLYQAYLDITASLDFGNGFEFSSSYSLNIADNLNNTDRVSNSVIPRVRSDINRYLREGKSGIGYSYFDKHGQLGSNIYYRGFAGILEDMYSGVGGELLFHSARSRFGYGLSLAAVKQRGFERDFSHRDYSVITGHASLFWASPYHNYDMSVHVGRYLAKDLGATFELTRKFSNGWEVGLFASFTDVSSDDFGEGSFDKGFVFSIPLNSLIEGNTRSRVSTVLRPVLRDGGQRLDGYSGTLWDKKYSLRYDVLSDTKSRAGH